MELMNAITFRNFHEDDIKYLLLWENDDFGCFMLGNDFPKTETDLKKEFIDVRSYDRNKIITLSDGENEIPVGYIKAIVDVKQRSANLVVYVTKEVRNKGFTHVALYKFLELLFDIDSLHRVHFSAFDFNKDSLNCMKHFHSEGTQREVKWYKGKYHDRHHFSILEHEWPLIKLEYEKRIQVLERRLEQRNKKEKVVV